MVNRERQQDEQKDSWVSEIIIKEDKRANHAIRIQMFIALMFQGREQYSIELWKFPVIMEYMLPLGRPIAAHGSPFDDPRNNLS